VAELGSLDHYARATNFPSTFERRAVLLARPLRCWRLGFYHRSEEERLRVVTFGLVFGADARTSRGTRMFRCDVSGQSWFGGMDCSWWRVGCAAVVRLVSRHEWCVALLGMVLR